MSEYENRAKRLKLIIEAKSIADRRVMVDSEKKSNFSSINPSSGAIVRGGSANAKGDVKKLVIKNFRGILMQTYYLSTEVAFKNPSKRKILQ